MRFRIYGDKSKICPLLDEFIKESKVEYDSQVKSLERMGIKLPVFEQIWLEEGDHIKLSDSMPEPPLPGFLKKRARDKACRALEGYMKTKGVEVRVEGF